MSETGERLGLHAAIEQARSGLTPEQSDYVDRLKSVNLIEPWAWNTSEFTPTVFQPTRPGGDAVPHLWRWNDYYPLILESRDMIGLGQDGGSAERRVLTFANPGLAAKDPYAATTTLYSDVQIVDQGEIAPSHRHTTTAIRICYQGSGWTVVNGEKVTLGPGDIVFTPQLAWHAHGNDEADPFVFMDVLDIPFLTSIDNAVWDFDYTKVTGDTDVKVQPVDRSENFSGELFRQGGVVPTFVKFSKDDSTPLLVYKGSELKRTLDALRVDDASPQDGICLELRNPITGTPASSTMAFFVQMFRPAERTRRVRRNSSAVYTVIEGEGRTEFADTTIEWSKNDVFAIPSWEWHRHINTSSDKDVILYSVSDRPVIDKFGLYREQTKTCKGEISDTGWVASDWYRS